MTSQKQLFTLPEEIHFLNGAYMSPLMKAVQEAGFSGIEKKGDPSTIYARDYFEPAERLRSKFGEIIHANPGQIALIPSASYGLKSAITNIPVNGGNHAIVAADEFPSDLYTIDAWCKQHGKTLKTVEVPANTKDKAATWNENIIGAINNETAAVVISSIHWTDGTIFNLKEIGEKCKATDTLFIVDGTQSVGALPIDVEAFQIDALICAGYKWLLGPYAIGLAYYSDYFNNAIPIEDSWMNRSNAADFTRLTKYVEDYKPGAARFNVGEFSNFIMVPMLDTALTYILEWKVADIQAYSQQLIKPLTQFLDENDYRVEEEAYRSAHLFGFQLPPRIDKVKLVETLQQEKIFVSLRGDAIRVSTHVYNTPADIDALIAVLRREC